MHMLLTCLPDGPGWCPQARRLHKAAARELADAQQALEHVQASASGVADRRARLEVRHRLHMVRLLLGTAPYHDSVAPQRRLAALLN